jgi:transposase
MSGDVYIFINGTRNQIKLLRWDDTGFVIYWKRLERGRFEIPKISADSTDYTISWGKLQLVLEGIEEGSVRWKKRYSYGSGGK